MSESAKEYCSTASITQAKAKPKVKKKQFKARIFRDGKQVMLGSFATQELADEAYRAAKTELLIQTAKELNTT